MPKKQFSKFLIELLSGLHTGLNKLIIGFLKNGNFFYRHIADSEKVVFTQQDAAEGRRYTMRMRKVNVPS